MKGTLLVLLAPNSIDLDDDLQRELDPHRLNWDASSWPRFYWDYWHFLDSHFDTASLANSDCNTNCKAFSHASVVAQLPHDYLPSAILTPDGRWNDLREFGWRLVDEPCHANTIALEQWTERVKYLRLFFADYIGIEVLFHC